MTYSGKVSAEQFEAMAETLFWYSTGGGPGAWRLADAKAKDGWREVVERQMRAAGLDFERRDPGDAEW